LEILTGSLPSPEEITARIDEWHEPEYRLAALYQYLICGRASEAVGKYQPRGIDAHPVELLGTEAFMFVVKTAKSAKPRRNLGPRLRGVVVPTDYPYAEEVYEWFREAGETPPFPFSYRSYLRRCTDMFEGFTYPVDYYEKIVYRIEHGEQVPIKEIIDGKEVNKTVGVPMHERLLPTHIIRHVVGMQVLFLRYKFDTVDLQLYAGWKGRGAYDTLPPSSRRYLHMAPTSMAKELLLLLGERYFSKLINGGVNQ